MKCLSEIISECKMTPKQLAYKSGYTQAHISRLSKGFGCRFQTYVDIAEACGYSVKVEKVSEDD